MNMKKLSKYALRHKLERWGLMILLRNIQVFNLKAQYKLLALVMIFEEY
jgi:hypothetical protein